jgi:hypothetical protein
MAILNGFPPNITKQTQKQLKRKNNEASYCHFTVAWTVAFGSQRKLIERVYL